MSNITAGYNAFVAEKAVLRRGLQNFANEYEVDVGDNLHHFTQSLMTDTNWGRNIGRTEN
jgi:hypothetical protein